MRSPLLIDPPDGGQAFHVVTPDVPGFGWSAPTRERGWNSRRTANAFGELMNRLGYDRYGLQGGDVGASVTTNMADLFPDRAIGLHLNFCLVAPYEGAPTPTEDEQREMARLAVSRETSMGYYVEQSTKPQTLGIGVQDSPAGLLAWIAEKLQAWSDSGGNLFRAFTPDQVLTWVTLYWVSRCVTSSMRIYWESRVGAAARRTRRVASRSRPVSPTSRVKGPGLPEPGLRIAITSCISPPSPGEATSQRSSSQNSSRRTLQLFSAGCANSSPRRRHSGTPPSCSWLLVQGEAGAGPATLRQSP